MKLLQRSKFKGVDKPIIFHDKAAACFRFASFVKFCAVVIIFCTIITFLSFPESSTPTHSQFYRPNFVERWIWGGQDPRYSTNTEHINWDDVKKVVTKLGELKEHHYSIGLLNFNHTEVSNWQTEIKFSPGATHIILHLQEADQNTTWDSLYPEWIDEEQDTEVPTCPSLPKIVGPRTRLDLIVVKLPCRNEANWSRDVARLHLQLSAANLAAVSAKGSYPGVHLLFITKCFPLPNLFTCKELIGREGNAWLYKPNLGVLSRKLQLPVGSCELALPFTNKGLIDLFHLNRTRRIWREPKAGSLRYDSSLCRCIRLRRHCSSSEHSNVRINQRHGHSGRRDNQRLPQKRVGSCRVEDPNGAEDPEPESRERRLQRMELQQVPAMAADRLRQDNIHRRRPPNPPQHRFLVQDAGDLCHGEQRHALQFRSDGDRAFQLHIQPLNGSHQRDQVLQRRRPRVPERDLHVVA
ncbi:UDP-glucuronate:xylan alpha-glucuronosyltransferase 1 [Linum perenne]